MYEGKSAMEQQKKLLEMCQEAIIHNLRLPSNNQQRLLDSSDLQSDEEDTHQHCNGHRKETKLVVEEIDPFDKIPVFDNRDDIELRIYNLRVNEVSSRHKGDLFKRYRKDQQTKFLTRMKQIEKQYPRSEYPRFGKGQFTLKDELKGKSETFPIKPQDFDKLKPQADLNDVIIQSYLKIVEYKLIPLQYEDKVHIFSSFFMDKLLGEFLKEEPIQDKDPEQWQDLVRLKVSQTYASVKRWTKRFNIFQKECLVIPVNSFKHWSCMIVLRPGQLLTSTRECQIIYCDSMFQKKAFMAQSIRKYLQKQLECKKETKMQLNDFNVPCYQLLLPRQTNTHDCGLYMLTYIQFLLTNRRQLQNLRIIANRKKLRLFPRSIMMTMRDQLKKLFLALLNNKQENAQKHVIGQYLQTRRNLFINAKEADYDEIKQHQLSKFKKILWCEQENWNPQQAEYNYLMKFYLDPQINFYQKDRI